MAGKGKGKQILPPLAPAPVRPEDQTYRQTPIIEAALQKMLNSEEREQYEVERVILTIFRKYFTLEDNWAITPEYRVPEKKRPDFCLEKFSMTDQEFQPKVFLELKSMVGDSVQKATGQAIASLPMTMDFLGKDFDSFLIVVRGREIAFYEYHNDVSDLDEDGIANINGAVPFSHPQHDRLPPGRPKYSDHGSYPYDNKGD